MKIRTLLARLALLVLCSQTASAGIGIADQPLFTTNNVPPNMMLSLSVEWPTGVVAAYSGASDYAASNRYLGYFDPERCYGYHQASGETRDDTPANSRTAANLASEYFKPTGTATNRACSGAFSGNYLNWAAMHAIDAFRFAMTGGDRVIDTATTTVVEKARHTGMGGHGQFPVKSLSGSTLIGKLTPYSWSNVYARVTNGDAELNPFSDPATRGRIIQISNNSSFSTGGDNKTYSFLVRVQVCDASAAGGLEYNATGDYQMCQQYPNGQYKPVGLIQKNAARMRFGAAGYLMDSSQARAGGVIRAKMKSVGPTYAQNSGAGSDNPYKEWDANTGVYVAHPDAGMLTSAETDGGKVKQSGVINYLNKFGKANGYKSNDPFSELYYASLRSLRNMAPPADYVSGLNSAMFDGFPVIQSIADESDVNQRPIQYWCQQSNIVGIADANCHTDVAIPGNTLTGYSGHPISVEDDSSINVKSLEQTLTPYAGLDLTTYYRNSGRKNTYHISALAYWANTVDILPSVDGKPWTTNTQKVKSYFVDVRENGSGSEINNQMWLGAKYGGFEDLNGDGKPANDTTWDTNKDGTPDNYFYGSRPDLMIASLNSIMNSALSRNLSSAGATFSTVTYPSDNSEGGAYLVSYNSKYWTGDVRGYLAKFDSNDHLVLNYKWSAMPLLDALVAGSGWDSARKVISHNGTAGIPFRLANLTSAQKSYLGNSQDMLEYLRGNRSKEGTQFRARKNVLGDIVDSEATVVGAPSASYSADKGYSGFKDKYAQRPKTVFVGANDGMLHAFNGDVGTATTNPADTAGKELWAYIPSFVLTGPTYPTTDGLQARTKLDGFVHKYYVNHTPVTRDVDFANTKGNKTGGDWHTILVGGLGKGGRGYYAIDVTNPSDWTSETAIAGKVLWEFTDEDMGYSYGRPIIAKTARDGWVVILSSGYNNASGKGWLYILNAKTGALIEKIGTGAGSASNPSGFANPAAFIPSFASYTLDYVYGGDLLGNLWRFDLRGTTSAYSAPTKIAELKDGSGNPQPVTTAPMIKIGRDGVKRWVFVGTGKLLDTTDFTDAQQQTLYAIRDGSLSKVYGSASNNETKLPTVVTGGFPVSRSNMAAVADLTTGYSEDANRPMGWYFDLAVTSGTAEKISSALTANEGLIAWTGYIPATSDPCSPGASSRVYVVDYDSAKSRLTDKSGSDTIIAYFESPSTLIKVQFLKSPKGKIRAVYTSGDAGSGNGNGNNNGQINELPGNFGRAAGKAIRLNWREILD